MLTLPVSLSVAKQQVIELLPGASVRLDLVAASAWRQRRRCDLTMNLLLLFDPSDELSVAALARHQFELARGRRGSPGSMGDRAAVVNRKMSAGNNTLRGAEAQATLMTVLHSARKRSADTISLVVNALRNPVAVQHLL